MRWLARYDPGVPRSLVPYPETTLLELLGETARRRPAHPFTLFKGARLGAGALGRLSDAFAAALLSLGIRKGDRFAVLRPNGPQFLSAEFGTWKAGAVVVPLNPIYGEEELARPLLATGAEVLLTLNPFYARVKAVEARTARRRGIATSIKECLRPAVRVLFPLFKEKKEGHRVALAPGDLWLSSLLREHARAAPPAVTAGPEDPALILMSGGTTGTPKGVVCPHRALVITGLQTRAWYEGLLREWEDTLLLPLPLFHAFGSVGAQSFAIVARARLALIPNPRDLKDVIATLRRVRPSFFSGVPPFFGALPEPPHLAGAGAASRSLKACISGAAPLLTETKKRLEALTGGRVVEGYSLTEALIASALTPAKGPSPEGSVGLPLPDVEMRIVDAEEGVRELAPGAVGEVLSRAPQLRPC